MTERLPSDETGIGRAVLLLRAGNLVAFPTETVYGLGADATNDKAVASIFSAKGRPSFNPLICHFFSSGAAFEHVVADARARALAAAFWPGPLTLVLPRVATSPISDLAAAGLPSLAVRLPDHPVARALLAAVGRPIAAPSANSSGRVSPTLARHVLADLDGKVGAVLDAGATRVGLESTVVDLTGQDAMLLRPGVCTCKMIEGVIGPIVVGGSTLALRGPGMMRSHYAPRLPVRPGATSVEEHEALLGFGESLPDGRLTINLSATGDLVEAAANFFSALRRIDDEALALGLTGIAVSPIPDDGIGIAINDRIKRAAAPRF